MKYIKLFEAFESTKLAKTLSYVDRNHKDSFLDELNAITTEYDFPMSKLNDDHIQYLPYHKALELGNDYDGKKFKWIKFWFNTKGEYILTTVVDGGKQYFKMGGVVEDPNQLKHLDYFYYEKFDTWYLSRVYIDEVGDFYAVFNDEDVSLNPSNLKDDDWKKYGNCANFVFEQGPRHKKYSIRKAIKLEDTTYNHNFILDVNDFEKYKFELDYLKDAEFALVLDLDKIRDSDLSVIKMNIHRADLKRNYNLSDEHIKRANISSYIQKMVDKLGLDDGLNIKNLNSTIIKVLGGKKIFYSIIEGGNIHNIEYISNKIFKFLKTQDTVFLKSIKSRIRESIVNSIETSVSINQKINNALKFSKKEGRQNCVKLLEGYLEIEKMTYDKFNSYEIETLLDIDIIIKKADYLYNTILHSSKNRKLRPINTLINWGLYQFLDYDDESIEKHLETIPEIKKIIRTL